MAAIESRTLPQSGVHASGRRTRGKYPAWDQQLATSVVRKSDGSAGRFVLSCAHVVGGQSIAQGLAKDTLIGPELAKAFGPGTYRLVAGKTLTFLMQLGGRLPDIGGHRRDSDRVGLDGNGLQRLRHRDL